MGAAGYQLNKKINNTVAYKKAQRPSPSAVKSKNISQIPVPPVPMTLDISRIPPKNSRGYQYFRDNITPAERAELDAYEARQANVPPVVEEVVDLNAMPFASTVDSPSIGLPEPIKVMGSRTEPTTPAFKAGDREWIYDDAGDKIGFTTYKEQKRYDSSGKVTGSKIVPRTTYYSPTTVQDTRQRKESYGTTNIAEIAAQLEAEAPSKARTGMDLFSEFDPNRGAMMGHSVDSYNRQVNVEQPLLEAFQDLDYKPYKEFDVPELDTGGLDYDKTKLYLNYGARGQLDFPSQEAEKEYNEKRRTGTFHDVSELLGLNPELGQHTMVWVKNPPEPSKWEKFLDNPVLQVAGMLYPPIALATTGVKLASGVDVSPVELATGLMTGLEMTGAVKAPVNAGKFDSTKLAGPVAPTGSTAGTGLFGTSYNQTKTALNVAAAGDAKGAAIALVGDNIIKGGLEKVGIDEKAITEAGIQYDDFEAGVNKTVQKLAEGEELDEALAFGVGKYIGEGGTLGSIDLPSINLPSINLGDSEILEPIADALSAAETAVRQGLSKFDKEVLQPVTKPIGDTLSAAETEVRQGLSTLDKEVLQPITQPIGDIAEDVAQVTGDIAEDVAQVTGDIVEDVAQESGDIIEDVAQGAGDVLSDLDTAIRQALPDIDLPSIDLPSIDLPSIDLDLPDIGVDFKPSSSTMVASGGLSPTRTTDSLFGNDLFAFETEIGISPEYFEYADILDDGGLMPRTKQRRMYPFT